MKTKLRINTLISLCFVFILKTTLAQNPIPNAGFENWTGNIPVGWTASNLPGFENITKSTDAYSGSFAARGEVISIAGTPLPPSLFTGSQSQGIFPVSDHHISFTGQYQFSPQGGDMLFIEIVFGNMSIGGGAEGHAIIAAGSSSYQQVEIVMVYDANNPPNWQPDHGNISITILPPENQIPHIGTWFLVDHFTFDNQPLAVNEIDETIPEHYGLEQNFPNPFNPNTNINFSLPEASLVNLRIYNIQGEEITDLVNSELSAGSYNVDWNSADLPSGVYVYVLRTKDLILSRKMLLMK